MNRNRKLNSIAASSLSLALGLFSINALAQVQNTNTQFQYDANGNLTQVTDPLQQITNQLIDPLNRVQQLQQPAPVSGAARPTIAYTYDGRDQLSSVTDPRNLVTLYTNNGLGNQSTLTSPDTGTTQRSYDLGGNVVRSTDARNQTTAYTYDVLNRLTTVTYGSGTPTAVTTTFQYDGGAAGGPNAKGRLTRVINNSGDTLYEYNGFGRVSFQSQFNNDSLQAFALGPYYLTSGSGTGKLGALAYPSGNQVVYDYDSAGRISSLTIAPTASSGGRATGPDRVPLLNGIGYHPFGPPISWTWGNSNATSVNTYARSIDKDGRITSFPLGNGVNNGLTRTMAFDAASRIISMTHNGTGIGTFAPANFDQSFTYDNLNRMTGITSVGLGNQAFTYDANGNRTAATFGASSYTNAISATSNQLASTTGPAPAKTNTYDAIGNLLTDGTIRFTFDARGRRDSALIGTNTVNYRYDGFGQRILKSGPTSVVPTGKQQYVYDGAGHLIGEYDATGAMIQETVYLGDLPVAILKQTVTGTAPSTVTTTQIYYVYADQINTPRVVTRATDNKMVWRWDGTDPFGLQHPNESPTGLAGFVYNPRFPGQLYDRETNLHYNYFRDYDPQLGRYVESDPIGLAGGINSYGYVGANPIKYTDPKGLIAGVDDAVVIGGLALTSACAASPGCVKALKDVAQAAVIAANAAAKICGDSIDKVRSWYAQRQTPDQEALGDLVRDVTHGGRKPVSDKDADTLLDWGREVGSNVRDDRNTDHWTGGPHIHIPGSGVGHIPVK